MISFSLTDEQQSARDAMRSFAAQAMRPIAREHDEAATLSDAFLAQAWELGLLPTQLPETLGGYGATRSPVTNAIVLEELAFGDAALALAATASSAFAYAVHDHGTAAQQQKYVAPLCSDAQAFAALAVNESHAAFDLTQLRTTAERVAGGYVLRGAKSFVPLADRAAHFLVVARSGDGVDAFIVGRDAAGLSIGDREKSLGLKSLPTATLTLDGVQVDAADRLGGDQGADIARIFAHSRVALAAVLTGIGRAVLEYCVPYAKDRVAFDEPIARKQSIAFRLAEMHMEIECARWMTWKAAAQLEQGIDAGKSAHLARLFAAEKMMWVADNGVQVLGGHGFIREHPVEMWYRNARTLGVLEGFGSV